MTCKKCGKEFGGNFCPYCGTKFDIESGKRALENCDECKSERTVRKKSKKRAIIISSTVAVIFVFIIGIFLCLNSLLSFENEADDSKDADANSVEKVTEKNAKKMIDLIEEISSLEDAGKGQQEIKSYIKGFEWVINVSETKDGGLTCVTEFGVTGVWTPKIKNTISNIDQEAQAQVVYAKAVVADNNYDIDSIAVLCPYASVDSNFNLDGYNLLGEIMDKYTDCDVSFFKDEEVSLELLKNLDQFDMVWFYSHGALSNVFNSAWAIVDSDPYTMTGEFVNSPSAYVLLSSDFFYGRTIVNLSDGRIGVGGNFYRHYYSENQLDGMFFHFASCNSMRTDKLADGLLSRGAAWVEGWDNSVYFSNDYRQFAEVIANLLDGDNIDQAMKDADTLVKDGYDFYQEDCKLRGKGETNYTLIVRDDLLGVYKGSYFANQGETGLTLTVFKEGKKYKALFDFYNLPGRTNAASGKYYMDVSYDINTDEYYFSSSEWVVRPADYDFVDLKGKLSGDRLSGESPTRFSVTKTRNRLKVSLEDMPIVAHDCYKGNQGDSTVYNLNGKGLSTYDEGKRFYGYGNVGVDGTAYSDGFEVWIARWNYTNEISWASATFDLGGKYKTLTGKTNLIKSYNTTNFDTTVYFYDGEKLLASYRLTNSDYIKNISVDVSGVKHLKLYVKDNVSASGGTSFALYDMFLDNTTLSVPEKNIPSDAYEYNGHYYKVFDIESNWQDAKIACEEMGGHLITVTSPKEQDVMMDLLSDKTEFEAYWIGGHKDDTWMWITGEPFEYTNWAEDPNGGDCMQAYSPVHYWGLYFQWDDTWNDGDDGAGIREQGYICEWE